MGSDKSIVGGKPRIIERNWFIILWLIIFPPLGWFFMIKYTSWRPSLKVIIPVVQTVLLLLIIFAGISTPPQILAIGTSQKNEVFTAYTDDASYKISGSINSVDSKVTLEIDGVAVDVSSSDKSFNYDTPVQQGDNTVVLVARNSHGEDRMTYKIHRTTDAEFAERKRRAEEEAARLREQEKQRVADSVNVKSVEVKKVAKNSFEYKVNVSGIDTDKVTAVTLRLVDSDGKKITEKEFVATKKSPWILISNKAPNYKKGQAANISYLVNINKQNLTPSSSPIAVSTNFIDKYAADQAAAKKKASEEKKAAEQREAQQKPSQSQQQSGSSSSSNSGTQGSSTPKKTTPKKTTPKTNTNRLPLKAKCKDGTYSYQKNVAGNDYRGMCSHHGGIAQKLGRTP